MRNLFRRTQVEHALDEELQTTLDLMVEEKRRQGLSPEEARRAAATELRIEPTKECVRDVRHGAMLEMWWQDVRYAARHLRRSPGFAVAVILAIALGIGANTTTFSMLQALVLKRLAIEQPDDLIAIEPHSTRGLPRSMPVSAVAALGRDGPLQHLCGYFGLIVQPIVANDTPREVAVTFVTSECFNAFGVRPVIGRFFTEDEAPVYSAGAKLAVISHRLWTTAYNADPRVIDRSLRVNEVELAIVGVLPQDFHGLEVDYGIDVFTPFDSVIAASPTRRQLASFFLGRLKPSVTLEQARAIVEARWPAVLQEIVPGAVTPSERTQLLDATPRMERMETGTSRLRAQYAVPVALTLGITSLLLLLACVNLGGLLLSRLSARLPELHLRLALGGTRWRVARQMLLESTLLAVSGAVLAMPLSSAAAALLATLVVPTNLPYTTSFAPGAPALLLAGLAAVVVAAAMSALPLIIAARRSAGVQTTWERTTTGRSGQWTQGLLVVQVALSVAIVASAALLTRSLYSLQHQDLGVRATNLLNVKLRTLPASSARGAADSDTRSTLEQIAVWPGVRSIAMSLTFPRVSPNLFAWPVTWRGEPYGEIDTKGEWVSPGFFATTGIPLLAGRDLSWNDTLRSPRVAVVSESLARVVARWSGPGSIDFNPTDAQG